MKKEIINLIRYKKDLRVRDHFPLRSACNQKQFPVLAVYVWEPSVMEAGDFSHFHQYRIQESLKNLKSSLIKLGVPLVMYHGEMLDFLDIVRAYYDIAHIYAHEETGNGLTYMRDKAVHTYCKQQAIQFVESPANAVVRRLRSRDVWDTIRKQRILAPCIETPFSTQKRSVSHALSQTCRDSFVHFVPADKPAARTYAWDIPGESAWHARLAHFLKHAQNYRYALSRPSAAFSESSRLSAYITYGNLSIRQIYQATTHALQQPTATPEYLLSLRAFRSRLHWHCHFVQKLESWPHIEYTNQNSAFDTIRNESNQEVIHARYHGRTWIPMIDAGMRCLHATWWINFRMRATLVSFICNTCLQPWQKIAHLLAGLFVDYEPGIHYSQLQMQSWTTGINTIRIYNPIKQLADKDTSLTFVRKRLPELQDLADEEVRVLWTSVWTAILEQKKHKYPRPVTDVAAANRYAREVLRWVRATEVSKQEAKIVYKKLGSRKKQKLPTQENLFT